MFSVSGLEEIFEIHWPIYQIISIKFSNLVLNTLIDKSSPPPPPLIEIHNSPINGAKFCLKLILILNDIGSRSRGGL